MINMDLFHNAVSNFKAQMANSLLVPCLISSIGVVVVSRDIFNGFSEYWRYAKILSVENRDKIFKSLDLSQRKKIEKSFKTGGWIDLMIHDEINNIIDSMEKKHGYNLLSIRIRAMRGLSVYVPRSFWDNVINELSPYDASCKHFVLGNLKSTICSSNSDVVFISREDINE